MEQTAQVAEDAKASGMIADAVLRQGNDRHHKSSGRGFRHTPSILDHVDYRVVETQNQKEEIYRLRYKAYLHEGAVAKSETEMVFDAYDDAPNQWVFGVYYRDVLMGSIRVGVLTNKRRESPAGWLFNDVLTPLIDAGQVIIDPTRFVADPDRAGEFPYLPLMSARLGWIAAIHFGADMGISIVRREHQPFYRRLFLQEEMAEPRLFPGLLKPVGLMGAYFSEVKDEVLVRHPFLRSTAFERRMLFKDSEMRMH